MYRSSWSSGIVALLVLFQCAGIAAFAASSKGSSMSELTPVDSLPSAPAPSRKLSTHRHYVRHPQHVTIPRLDAEPKFSDFLTGRPRSATVREMLRINHFLQRTPEDGKPPTERTIAYLGYTRKYFYVAFICFDKTPKLIRAHMLARDTMGDDDNVEVFLDTFHDQRRAFLFNTNALGIQADALYSEQDGSDYSFNTVWDTWGKRTSFGYVVMMRIPFASLYFAKAAPNQMRTWGIILERFITHENESLYWPRSTHNVAGLLTQDIAADGFMNIAHGKNWQFEPYTLARNLRQLDTIDPKNPYFKHKHLQAYAGMDAKFILHNSLILDTTFNPDFSQVGVDNPASPNQRFPPYFSEVRPFFIENSSYFQTPINLYYSNSIVMPQFGARLTGKLGPWALGVLGVDDRGPGKAVPPGDPEYGTRAHVYLGRVNRDIGTLSNAGVIYADREYRDSFNRVGGFDYRARLKNRWTLTGQALTSVTKNISNSTSGEQECLMQTLTCSGQIYYQGLSYSDLHNIWWLSYDDTSAGFVTDTGFFRRPDIREPAGYYYYKFRPKGGPVLQHGPSLYVQRIWDHTGLPLESYISPAYSLTFRFRTSISASLGLSKDTLRPIDYSALSDNVVYHDHTSAVSFYTSPVPYIAFGAGVYTGRSINFSPPASSGPVPVNVTSPNVNLELKPIGSIDMNNSYVFTHFTNPSNNALVYDNHQVISRWNYQLTKSFSFNLIGQYVSTLPNPQYTSAKNSKNLFADALFTYLPHPGTAVYFGYIGNFVNLNRALCTREASGTCNQNDPILPATYSSLMNNNKTIYLKMTYLFRF